MVSPPAGIAVALLLLCFASRRRQVAPAVIAITPDGCFAVPDENRSNLTLTTESRAGPGWLQLSFSDRPGKRLLLLRDQVDARDWRVLQIAILEGR